MSAPATEVVPPPDVVESTLGPGSLADVEAIDLLARFVERLEPLERRIVRGRVAGLRPGEIARDCFPNYSPRAARRATARALDSIWSAWQTFLENPR